jgi:hypothetical protein
MTRTAVKNPLCDGRGRSTSPIFSFLDFSLIRAEPRLHKVIRSYDPGLLNLKASQKQDILTIFCAPQSPQSGLIVGGCAQSMASSAAERHYILMVADILHQKHQPHGTRSLFVCLQLGSLFKTGLRCTSSCWVWLCRLICHLPCHTFCPLLYHVEHCYYHVQALPHSDCKYPTGYPQRWVAGDLLHL